MNNIQKYTEELSKVPEDELLYIIYNLLDTNKVSFEKLAELRIASLKAKDEANRELVCELGFSLVMYKDKITAGTWEQAEQKANKALIQSKLFKGTEYEINLAKKLKDE